MTESFTLDCGSGSSSERLKAFFARLKALDDQIQDLAADKRDVIAEAKLAGFHGPALTLVIRRARKDPAAIAEGDALVETYEAITCTGAGAAGTLTFEKGADGTFVPKMVHGGSEAEEKLNRSQKARRTAMTLGELAQAAREGDAR